MILTIPRAQTLRFVNITSYPPTFYNHDNTLLQDEGRFYDEPIVYFQKFNTGDEIKVQIITDYENITLKVYDCGDTLVDTITLNDLNAPITGAKVLEGTINTSMYGNIYYAKIEASGVGVPAFTFQSEYFEVSNFATYPIIQWKNSDYSGLYFATGTQFGFRIEADITPYKGESDTESFEAYNSVVVNVKTTTKRMVTFSTDEIPRYIYEKLVLAFAHKNVYINGIEYVAVDSPNAEQVPNTQVYFFDRVISQSNYEVYDTLESATGGEDPETGTDNIIWMEDNPYEQDNDIILDDTNTLLIPY
jgi:hypothetical protein